MTKEECFKIAKERFQSGEVKSERVSFVCQYAAELRYETGMSQSDALAEAHLAYNEYQGNWSLLGE